MDAQADLPVPRAALLRALRRIEALAGLTEDDLAPLPAKGTAHGHVAIVPEIDGQRLCARIAYAHPGDPTAPARLAVQAEAFRRCAPSGVTPRLFATVPPDEALPGGLLVVQRIEGRTPWLPSELQAMARTLAAIHALPVPAPGDAPPLPFHDDPAAALLAAIEANTPFFARMAIAERPRRMLEEELAAARAYVGGRRPPCPRVLALSDTHPGNFLVDGDGKAWFVDLEKVNYGAAAVDLAHATLATSTRWDRDVNLSLAHPDIEAFYRTYLNLVGPERAAALRPHLLPLRRMTWLRTMAFFARWWVQTDPSYAGTEPDRWSDSGLSFGAKAHFRRVIAGHFDSASVGWIRREWEGRHALTFYRADLH